MVSPKVLLNICSRTNFENRYGVLQEIGLCCCSEAASGVGPRIKGQSPHSAGWDVPQNFMADSEEDGENTYEE